MLWIFESKNLNFDIDIGKIEISHWFFIFMFDFFFSSFFKRQNTFVCLKLIYQWSNKTIIYHYPIKKKTCLKVTYSNEK